MKKILLSLSAVLALSACKNEETLNIQVQTNLTVQKSPSSSTRFVVPAGNYVMNIKTSSSSAKVKLQAANGAKHSFKMKGIKEIGTLASQTTNVNKTIPGAQLGQPFDLNIKATRTLVSTSAEQSFSDSCVLSSYTAYREVCSGGDTTCWGGREECVQRRDTNGDERSDFDCYTVGEVCQTTPVHCHDEPYTEYSYGSQTVSGRTRKYKTISNLSLIQGGKVVAKTQAVANDFSSFDETFRGSCH